MSKYAVTFYIENLMVLYFVLFLMRFVLVALGSLIFAPGLYCQDLMVCISDPCLEMWRILHAHYFEFSMSDV